MPEMHPDVQLARRYGIRPYLHLVACGQVKQDEAAPASQLYTGDLTRKAIAFASTGGGAAGGSALCMILSAKHGLLDPAETVDPYDARLDDLTPGQLDEWRWMIVEQLPDLGCLDAHIYIHAGARYVSKLRKALAGTGANVVPWFSGKGIGERKQSYKRIAQDEAGKAERHAAADRYFWNAS